MLAPIINIPRVVKKSSIVEKNNKKIRLPYL